MSRILQLLPVTTGERVLEIIPALQAALAGTGPVLLPVPAQNDAETARLARSLDAGAELADWEDEQHDPTAVVIATSGSTGAPKGALLPAAALMASAEATRRRLTRRADGNGDQQPPGNWLLALSATHIAGLQVLLRALAEGTEPTILDTAASFTAERFVAAVDRMPPGPRFTSLVPSQLSRILPDPASALALRTFDAVLVGGASTSAALLHAAEQAGIRVVTTYGMSETCGGCVYDGVPLDGVTLAGSFSKESTARPGRLSITGPVVARGYRGRPGHRSFSRAGGNRFRTFLTDDLGVFDGAGWRIVGRVDDVIITGGIKIDPAVVEAVLLRVAGVAEVIVTGIPDPAWGESLIAVVVPSAGGAPTLRALRAAAGGQLGAAAAPKDLVLVEQLPLRGPGKPDRAAIRDLATAEITARLLGNPETAPVIW
jgi:O-succinylbenzoic acid--CoA ligase